MNVYDFDNTIFRGDSTARFCLFLAKQSPRLLLGLPRIAWAFGRCATGRLSKTLAKQTLYRLLLQPQKDLSGMVDAFWRVNMPRVKTWYIARKQDDDLIISASPEFLLRPACERLGITRLIASQVDPHTGDYFGLNCHGEEKVRRFRQLYDEEPDCFFSDSATDTPMARISAHAYWVKGDTITAWPGIREGGSA